MTLRALAESTGADVLAYIPSPPRGVWYLGPFPLRAYAICIIIGIVAAIWLGDKRWVARGGESGAVLDIAMFAVPLGLIGGRLYHVATDWEKYFGPHRKPDAHWWAIWQGGLGIWGAVLLGAFGAWIGCRHYRIPLPAFGDAIAPGVLLAQAIGRLGNYFNQELFGRETTLPWGLEIFDRFDANGGSDPMNGVSNGVVVHVVQPTFLYELLWNLLGVAILLYVDRKFRIGHGRLFALYVAIYCFGRFFVELLRDDEATHIAGLRVNTFTSAIVFVCAVAYFLLATKGRETPAQVRAGVERPWPWQFGALRAYGAAGAAAAEPAIPGTDAAAKEPAAEKCGVDDSTDKTDSAAESESESADKAEPADEAEPAGKAEAAEEPEKVEVGKKSDTADKADSKGDS
ncbi:prolipoprotein diacylglyceryl transferase [Nocardia sp. NPDC005746]|uniref:prolipoprotein diacylglyceryl transferase n=1 Tax=Nocardia sp. NPDC005746 TaxID=3157062 RepID=UPI0033E92DAC